LPGESTIHHLCRLADKKAFDPRWDRKNIDLSQHPLNAFECRLSHDCRG
jgi:hypothetical protein